MGAPLQSHGQGPLYLTKGRLFILVSLTVTWLFAHMLPHYEPAIKNAVSSRLQEARHKIPSIHVDWHRDENPRSNFNESKVALLVEPRYLPHLVPLILHMIYIVPPDWRFVFVGSEKSTKAIGRSFAIKHQQVVGKLDLLTLPKPWDIGSKEMVYRLMTDMRFYDEFLPAVEWILKYESDSIMCANSESSLNDWLDWSWAGAPRYLDDRFSGNGGLSMRRVTAIRRVLNFQERYNNTLPEDQWFGQRLWVLPGEKVASGTHGALAVEDVYFEKPLGYHVRDGGNNLNEDVWGNKDQRKKMFDYCPELGMIMDMKFERERCPGDDGNGIQPNKDDEEAKKKADEEAKKKADEEAKKKADEEAKQKADEEAKKADEEARKKADEEAKNYADTSRRRADEEFGDKGDEEAKDQAEGEHKEHSEAITAPP